MTQKAFSCWLAFAFLCYSLGASCQSSSSADQAAAHTDAAHRLLRENKPAEAIPEFRAALAINPEDADARANLGVLLYFAQDYPAAIPELREAVRLKPDIWKIQALLGMAEKRTGDSPAAEKDLEFAVPQIQENKLRGEAGLELIEIYSASARLDKAAQLVSKLLTLDPENREILYASYRIYSDLSRQSILSLSLVAPTSALLVQAGGHEAALRGDKQAAIKAYRRALALDPSLPGLHFELAEMLSSLPSSPDAQAESKREYQAALVQNPFDEKSKLRLAEIALRQRETQKALQLSEEALQLEPNDSEANMELGKAFIAADQPAKALEPLEHAAQLDPTNAALHYRLNTLYHRLGRNEEAAQQMKEYHQYKQLKQQMRQTWQSLNLSPERSDTLDESSKDLPQ